MAQHLAALLQGGLSDCGQGDTTTTSLDSLKGKRIGAPIGPTGANEAKQAEGAISTFDSAPLTLLSSQAFGLLERWINPLEPARRTPMPREGSACAGRPTAIAGESDRES